MGRNKKISHEMALSKAMEVFWKQGFAVTSVEDLQQAMGVQRGSVYGYFKDKRSLFLESWSLYRNEIVLQRRKQIEDAPTGFKGIQSFFLTIVNHSLENKGRSGCMNTNTAVEFGTHDPEISKRVKDGMQNWEEFWLLTLKRARKDGSLQTKKNLRDLAKFLVTLTQGLNVLGKSCPDKKFLMGAMKIGLKALE